MVWMALLAVTGVAFVATAGIGTAKAVVDKIRENRANKVKTPKVKVEKPKKEKKVEDKTEDKEEKKETKKEKKRNLAKEREAALKELQGRINDVKLSGGRLDSLITKKLSSLNLNPNTEEHKNFIRAAMKTRWESTASKYIAQVQKVMENLKDTDDFEKVLAKVPVLASSETFVDKCEGSLIPSVSEKYRYYCAEKEKVDISALDLSKKENRTSMKAIASKEVVDALFAKIENMIVNDTKVSDFRVAANADFRVIANEIANVNEFAKLKKNLQKTIEDVRAIEKKSNATKEDVERAIADLAKQVAENKKSLDLIDLDAIDREIKALSEKFGAMDESLQKKLASFAKSTGRLIDTKVKETVKGTVGTTLETYKNEISYIIGKLEGRLDAIDYVTMIAKFEELTKAYEEVDKHIDDAVKAEVEALKKSINRGVSVRIGNILKKKMKDFDEAHKQEIINFAIIEAKNIVIQTTEQKMTEDEMIDKVIEAINEKYRLSKTNNTHKGQ